MSQPSGLLGERGRRRRRSAAARNLRPGPHGTAAAVVCRARAQEGRCIRCTDEELIMSAEENKAIVGRWFTEFWGKEFNPDVIDEIGLDDGVTALTQLGLISKG